jgi:hypothetical protein
MSDSDRVREHAFNRCPQLLLDTSRSPAIISAAAQSSFVGVALLSRLRSTSRTSDLGSDDHKWRVGRELQQRSK